MLLHYWTPFTMEPWRYRNWCEWIRSIYTSKYLTKLQVAHRNCDFASKTWLFVFVVIFSSSRKVLYIMTLTSDIDRFTIPHYGSGAFRTNDTIAMEEANRWANRSLTTPRKVYSCLIQIFWRGNITALYYRVTAFLQVVLCHDLILICNAFLLAQAQWRTKTAQQKPLLTFS